MSASDPRLTRRQALHYGAGSIALLCSFSSPVRGRPGATSASLRAADQAPFTPFRADLPLMPELVPTQRRRTADVYDVFQRPGIAEILPGYQTPVYGYEGISPGPTIRATKGRTALVRQHNQLTIDTVVHLHGGFVPAGSDGHPMDLVAPGRTFVHTYPNRQDAATLWYHDHRHGETARSIYFGLAAFYLLGDEREKQLELPSGDFDLPLMIQDKSFNRDGSLRYAEDVDLGFRGDTILVNGAVAPRVAVKQRLYRLRFLNASNARSYSLVLGQGREMIQIASDGGLLERPLRRTRVPLAPAERIEVLVDFRRYGPGTELVLHNELGEQGRAVSVMRFDVERSGGSEEARVPARMRKLETPPRPVADRRWELALATKLRPEWQISGQGFDMNRIDVRPRRGTTERWHWVNLSNRVHPMHLHGMFFRVLSRTPGGLDAGERGLKDTVAVGPGQTVVVQPWFKPYTGRYVFHCHAAEHGNRAMMRQMEVVA